jgi:hypothetical protein
MTLPEQIRRAVAGGDFAGASRLFDEYARGVRDSIERGSCTEEAMRETCELVRWTRQTALAARAHLQDQLQDLRTRIYISGVYRAGE